MERARVKSRDSDQSTNQKESNQTDQSKALRAGHFRNARFIRQVCDRVDVHPRVTITALIIYHRVYDFDQMATFDELDPAIVCCSCVWLAAKGCEELSLRLRDVVNVVYDMLNPGSRPLALDDDYYDLRDTVTTVELLLLRILEFTIPRAECLSYLVKFLASLEKWLSRTQKPLLQAVSRTSVSLLLDGLHQSTFLSYADPAVALACLDMAAKTHGMDVPLDQYAHKSWRKALYAQADWPLIKKIQNEIMRVYDEDEPNFDKEEKS